MRVEGGADKASVTDQCVPILIDKRLQPTYLSVMPVDPMINHRLDVHRLSMPDSGFIGRLNKPLHDRHSVSVAFPSFGMMPLQESMERYPKQ